jgi:hypothetical protein
MRLFLELLENKKKVKTDKLYEIYTSPDVIAHLSLSPAPIVSPRTEPVVESLLADLLLSERDLNPHMSKDLNPSPLLIPPAPQPKVAPPAPPPTPSQPAAPVKKAVDKKAEKPPAPVVAEKPEKKPVNIEAKKIEYTIKKQELLVKFDILRKNSERNNIPQYTMNHNYHVMESHYKLLVKQLHLDQKIIFYKQCLMGASGYLEIFMGEAFLGLDMKGFTEFQANSMSNYDDLLLQIGEKSYTPNVMKSMPVEMQLLMAIGIQTVIFIGSKILTNKTGLNVGALFQNATTAQSSRGVNLEMPENK